MSMRPVKISEIVPDSRAEFDYYSSDQRLLIRKGTFITASHLDVLRRSRSWVVHVRDAENMPSPGNKRSKAAPESPALFDDDDTITKLLPSRAGFNQLLRSKRIRAMDGALSTLLAETPSSGIALKEFVSQVPCGDRTDDYKQDQAKQYMQALRNIELMLDSLAHGHAVDGSDIRVLVENLVDGYVRDPELLVNLSANRAAHKQFLYQHSLNSCILAINIAAEMGFDRRQVVDAGMAAMMHDIGMLLLPEELICKQSRLSDDDAFEIKKHPMLSLHLLEKYTRIPEVVALAAYQEHERSNGSGYPKHRTEKLIHPYAQIIHVVDIFEALSSPRTYRKAVLPHKSVEEMLRMTSKGELSSPVMRAFLRCTSYFPIGSILKLNNGCAARVVQSGGDQYTRPVVSMLTDTIGNQLNKREIFQIDLRGRPDLQVVAAFGFDHIPGINRMEGF